MLSPIAYLDDTRSITLGLGRGSGGFWLTKLYMIWEHLSKFDNLYSILYNGVGFETVVTKNLSLHEDVRRSKGRLA